MVETEEVVVATSISSEAEDVDASSSAQRDVTGSEGAAAESFAGSSAQEQRRDWARRIRGEQRLPGALRERLAAAVEESAQVEGAEEPRLTVSQVANVLAEAVPSLLVLDAPRLAVHPAGEAFFRQGQLSDDDAARIAREQLVRTGFNPSR